MSTFVLQPWHLLVTILAGLVNQEQQRVIDYLRTENQVLKEKIGKKRILLNDDQRRRLAVKGNILGRKALASVATIVTPDSILRWHRKLIAAKWDCTTSPDEVRMKQIARNLSNDGFLNGCPKGQLNLSECKMAMKNAVATKFSFNLAEVVVTPSEALQMTIFVFRTTKIVGGPCDPCQEGMEDMRHCCKVVNGWTGITHLLYRHYVLAPA